MTKWLLCGLAAIAPLAIAKTFVIATYDASTEAFPDAIPLAERMYQIAGHELSVVRIPANRSLIMANAGEIDGELLRFDDILLDAPNLVLIEEPIAKAPVVIFAHQSMHINSIEDLKGLHIASTRGTKVIQQLASIYEFSVVETNNFHAAFAMVESNRAHATIFIEDQGNRIIAELALSNVSRQGKEVSRRPFFHVLHNTNAQYLPELTQALIQAKTELAKRQADSPSDAESNSNPSH